MPLLSIVDARTRMVYHDLNLGSQDTASDGELRECLATSLASGFSTVALTQRPAVQGRLSDSDRCG